MKKFFPIVLLSLLIGCSTSKSLLLDGKIKQNMSKNELRESLMFSFSGDDPFIPGSGSEWISLNNSEILWGSNKNIFFVFQNVSEKLSCGMILCQNGNGTLASWHSTLEEARKSAKSNYTISSNISKKTPRDSLASRWNDPGYTKAYFPQKESFWILIKNPPTGKAAVLYAETACQIAKNEYGVSGFTITIWNFNNQNFGKARCY